MVALKNKFTGIRMLLLVCFVFILTHAYGQNPLGDKRGKNPGKTIDSIIQSLVELDKIPGAVIQVKRGERVIYKNAFGFAEKYDFNHQLPATPEKMTTNTLFDIASLTKVIGTTSAIMILVDRGVLAIQDPVGKYIKDFDSGEKKKITIYNLLTHTAGLYEWYPLYYRCSNKRETFRLIGELPLKYPVGVGRHYSDLGFVLLGEIIELVSGSSFQQFLKENIFDPLDMKSTGFNPLVNGHFSSIAATSDGNPYERRMVHDSTLGFRPKEIDPDQWNGWRNYLLKGEVNDGNAWYANGGISGAAGLFSTVEDLQILVDLLMKNGKYGKRQFISEKTVAVFLKMDKFKNGLGWMMDPDNSFMKNAPEGTFGHTGFTGTSIAVVPKYDISVIILINRQNIGLLSNAEYFNVNPIRQRVFEVVLKYCE